MTSAARPSWTSDVLAFWFEECTPSQWFKRDDAFDEALRARFGNLHSAVAATPTEACLTDVETALAATIVLDQFSRNIFRDTPAAFASDANALTIAQAAVQLGFDLGLPDARRQFFYLPFEHAEDPAIQARSVALFALLGPEPLRWANAHKAIIDRFGRFPHRNATLGRMSTPEETAFLREPDSSF